MATYTLTLREYIENFSRYEHYSDGKDMKLLSNSEKVEIGREHLFDFDYPFYGDDEERAEFERHFIRTFYMREIGVETIGLFKFNLETWLLIHMPYFNQLFESELIEFEPLENWKVDTTHQKAIQRDEQEGSEEDYRSDVEYGEKQDLDSSHSGEQATTGDEGFTGQSSEDMQSGEFDRQLRSDNPDSRLHITTRDGGGSGNDVGSGAGSGVIEYASEITEDDTAGHKSSQMDSEGQTQRSEDSTTSGSEQRNQQTDGTSGRLDNRERTRSQLGLEDEEFSEEKRGKVGSSTYAEMLMDYRKSFLRIEQQIFNEMQELFMLVY